MASKQIMCANLMGARFCSSTLRCTCASGNLALPSPCAHQMPTTEPSIPYAHSRTQTHAQQLVFTNSSL
jgi:hypothetical protein